MLRATRARILSRKQQGFEAGVGNLKENRNNPKNPHPLATAWSFGDVGKTSARTKHFINNSDDNAINIYIIQYLFTYKAHSVIRHTLNLKMIVISKQMKISLKCLVIRHTQNCRKLCRPPSLYLQQFASKSY